jgi:hypothetical protein
VRVLRSINQMHLFNPGEVLVADMTDPDWEPIMKPGRSHRDQSRWPDVPCGDHWP